MVNERETDWNNEEIMHIALDGRELQWKTHGFFVISKCIRSIKLDAQLEMRHLLGMQNAEQKILSLQWQ